MRRSFPLAVLIAAAAITLAACGGSSKPSTKNTAKGQNPALAMAKCMRANGVPNFPDPSSSGTIQVQGNGQTMTVNGVPVSAPAFRAATDKCQSKLPKGTPVNAAQIAAIKKNALKMADCMRSHGVPNFPDPQIRVGPGGHGIEQTIGAPGSGLNPNSPAFQHAQSICVPAAGQRGGLAIGGPGSGKQTQKAGS